MFQNFFFTLQLAVSCVLLWRECRTSPSVRMTTEWKSVRLYPIPSIIYLVHNNVQFATLVYVDTSTYQIMGNLKIVTTGILFRCLLFLDFLVIKTWIVSFGFCCLSKTLSNAIWFLTDWFICSLECFRLFLRRKLSNLQWMAIVLLAVGTTTSQVIIKKKNYSESYICSS